MLQNMQVLLVYHLISFPVRYLRGAEVLLNVAEAYYRTGNGAQAF